MGPTATGLQGLFLFSPVSQPVAGYWSPAGHRLTDWRAATLQLAAAAIDRANISACYDSEIHEFGVSKTHWHSWGSNEFFEGLKALALLALA